MIRRLLPFLLLALFAPFASASAQAPHADRCLRHPERIEATMCESLRLFGLPPAEARLAAGEEIHRAFLIGGWGHPIIAVEYRRVPGHEPMVSIHGGRDGRFPGENSGLSAAVPQADWERLSASGRSFDGPLVPRPAGPHGEILVCADGYSLLVETTDPFSLALGERLRRQVAASCPDNPGFLYAEELLASAIRLLPACAGLAPRTPGNEADLLRDCMTLAGDRMAAAEAHNRLGELRRARTAEQVARLFAADVRFDWNGGRVVLEDAAAALAGHFYARRLIGETARRVRVEGLMSLITRAGDGPEVEWDAPVTLIFADSPAQGWQIAEARVGAFARADASTLSPRRRR
jgi:hypothetical protein